MRDLRPSMSVKLCPIQTGEYVLYSLMQRGYFSFFSLVRFALTPPIDRPEAFYITPFLKLGYFSRVCARLRAVFFS